MAIWFLGEEIGKILFKNPALNYPGQFMDKVTSNIKDMASINEARNGTHEGDVCFGYILAPDDVM